MECLFLKHSTPKKFLKKLEYLGIELLKIHFFFLIKLIKDDGKKKVDETLQKRDLYLLLFQEKKLESEASNDQDERNWRKIAIFGIEFHTLEN